MTEELTHILIGACIAAPPFLVLYTMANIRAKAWQELAERTLESNDKIYQDFMSLHAQFLRLHTLYHEALHERDEDDSESWKWN